MDDKRRDPCSRRWVHVGQYGHDVARCGANLQIAMLPQHFSAMPETPHAVHQVIFKAKRIAPAPGRRPYPLSAMPCHERLAICCVVVCSQSAADLGLWCSHHRPTSLDESARPCPDARRLAVSYNQCGGPARIGLPARSRSRSSQPKYRYDRARSRNSSGHLSGRSLHQGSGNRSCCIPTCYPAQIGPDGCQTAGRNLHACAIQGDAGYIAVGKSLRYPRYGSAVDESLPSTRVLIGVVR
jgi:hypothetical protein